MYNDLTQMLPEGVCKPHEPMSMHTTFKIGGPADLLVSPASIEQMKTVLHYCNDHKVPVIVIGAGSNLLVRDKGIRGIVIKLGRGLKDVSVEDKRIYAEAGITITELSKIAARHSLSGLEFAEGIPGSLGGAVFMNAGAYGGEMKDLVEEVIALDATGDEHQFHANDFEFSYRKSIFQTNGFTILKAVLKLQTGAQKEIQKKMKQFASSRREKQPVELPCAGSVFKRPEGHYVGTMVEKLGFKGLRIGGAEVSVKHAGFIVNIGGATAADVLELIQKIQEAARGAYNVELHPELRILGEE